MGAGLVAQLDSAGEAQPIPECAPDDGIDLGLRQRREPEDAQA
jgi:hypothetical protein